MLLLMLQDSASACLDGQVRHVHSPVPLAYGAWTAPNTASASTVGSADWMMAYVAVRQAGSVLSVVRVRTFENIVLST